MNSLLDLINAGGGVSQFLGFVLGVAGAGLVASNRPYSRYGFPLFMAANFAMIVFALHAHAAWLLAQQVAFTVTSYHGLARHGFLPWHGTNATENRQNIDKTSTKDRQTVEGAGSRP